MILPWNIKVKCAALCMWINWACLVNLVSSSTMSCYSLQKNGPGAPGGQSWTVEWLRFDNSYFKVRAFCHILHAEKLIRVHHLLSGSNTSGYQRETRSGSSGPTYRCCFIWGPKVQGDLWWSTVWRWYPMKLIVELTVWESTTQPGLCGEICRGPRRILQRLRWGSC